MSKKKSYMDKENILSEGLLKILGNLIPFKKLMKKAFSPKDKDALKDPGVKKALDKFNTQYKKAKKDIDDTAEWVDKEFKRYEKEKAKLAKTKKRLKKKAGL